MKRVILLILFLIPSVTLFSQNSDIQISSSKESYYLGNIGKVRQYSVIDVSISNTSNQRFILWLINDTSYIDSTDIIKYQRYFDNPHKSMPLFMIVSEYGSTLDTTMHPLINYYFYKILDKQQTFHISVLFKKIIKDDYKKALARLKRSIVVIPEKNIKKISFDFDYLKRFSFKGDVLVLDSKYIFENNIK